MKSKFKNPDCKYWKLRRKIFTLQLAQMFIMFAVALAVFFTDEKLHLGIVLFALSTFFILHQFQQYYEIIKNGGNHGKRTETN